MRIKRCKTNHLVNPMGFNMTDVTVSWVAESEISTKQSEARVQVAMDEAMTHIVYDSGMDEAVDSRGHELVVGSSAGVSEESFSLSPYTRYYWTVTVRGDAGDEGTSDINWFETGKLKAGWTAGWITTPWDDQSISPYIRKKVNFDKPIIKGRAYVIGLGLYEMEINGKRVGKERLTPYCNAYDAWLQYQTYDVTDHLKKGGNAIGVMLGNGWAKGPFGTFGEANTPYIDDYALLCEVHITYEDGSQEIVVTDESWLCHQSPVLDDTIYDGETYDANLRLSDWSETGCDESQWENATSYTPQALGPVEDRMSPPVLIKEEIEPVALIKTPKDEWVLDLGQNIIGWVRFEINEPAGTKITLSHGETLQEGCFYRDNLRKAKAQYTYISDGKEASVEPHFTFFGFRYVKLEGFTGQPDINDFTGCAVYSDLETIGNIVTSDPMVNRLFKNALWSQKDNFLDVPTDCPQRDERMGWTGDAQVFCGTASYNMDTYAFYTKFMRDLYEEQKFSNGMVASVVPTFYKVKHQESGFMGGGACAWSDAATVIPWQVYLHTGDKNILRRQYQSMKDWVDWIIAKDKATGDNGLWDVGFQFGDWLALDGPVKGGVYGGTDHGLLASAYYCLSAGLVAKAAKVLGYEEDAKSYSERSQAVKKAIQDEYFSKSGRSVINTQTAHVVALHFDLVEEAVKGRVLNGLIELLKKNEMHLKTGFIGTPYLCRALSDHGASEEAYQIFTQKDYPGWLYEVGMGATTIWERWDSILPDGKISGTGMNSLNHYAYGSIVEWMYRNVCGIKPLESAPGFKQFVIKPEINGRLDFAEASVNTSMGKVRSRWEIADDYTVVLEVEVPFNAEAKLIMTGFDHEEMVLEAGVYSLTFKSKNALTSKYDLSTPLWELKNDKKAKAILEKYFPHFVNSSKDDIGFEFPYSIQEVLSAGDVFAIRRMFRGVDISAYEQELMSLN